MSKKIYGIKTDILGNENKSKNIKEGECIFPFIYNNKVYNKCLKTKKGSICATEIDKQKKLKKYGYCSDKFKKTKKSIKNKTKKSKKKIKEPKSLRDLDINNLNKIINL